MGSLASLIPPETITVKQKVGREAVMKKMGKLCSLFLFLSFLLIYI